MAKSKKNLSVMLKGILDLTNGTITETTPEADLVYSYDEIMQQFDGRDVSIQIKETSDLESV